MNNNKCAVVVLGLLLSLPAVAGNFMVMPEVGTGDINLRGSYLLEEGVRESEDAYSLGVIGGYKFDSNIILGASLSSTSTEFIWFWGAFDEYSLDERGLLIGYSINAHPKFRIVPMIGWSSWELTFREGAFLNPGPEDEITYTGTDTYARINFEFPVSDLFQIVASYVYGDYDFGTHQSTRIGFKFEF